MRMDSDSVREENDLRLVHSLAGDFFMGKTGIGEGSLTYALFEAPTDRNLVEVRMHLFRIEPAKNRESILAGSSLIFEP